MNSEYDFYFVMAPISVAYPSGGIKVIYKLAKKLADRHYKVAIHFLTDPFRIPRNLFPYRKKITNMGLLTYVLKNTLNNKFSYRYIIPIARKLLGVEYSDDFGNVDIIFSKHGLGITSKRYIATDYVTAYFVAYEIKNGLKYFISQHDEADPVYLGNLSWLAEQAYKLPLKLVVINDDMVKKYAENNPVLFHVGVDDYFFNSYCPIEKHGVTEVLIPLRIGEMKGAVYGIDAAKLINQNILGVKISAFGNYPQNEVPTFIDYRYLPSNGEVLELYRKATIFVLPSILEGMPAPTLEAMASGCVVVSADCVGTRVYLKDGLNSIIVPVRDSKALFYAVQRLFADKDLMEKLRSNGIETALHFTYDRMVDEFINAI